MIAIGDTHEYRPKIMGAARDINVFITIHPYLFNPPGARHNRGANIVFCDGHVEWGRQSAWTRKTPEIRRRWNSDNEPHPETWKQD
jgi:prepilin-type processing-associated H-X9-DG protein